MDLDVSRHTVRSIFDDEQQYEDYLSALNDRFVPLKFGYIGPAAHTHDRLVRSQEYGLADVEAQLLGNHLQTAILPHVRWPKLSVIDVGPGNGRKALPILASLIPKTEEVRYIGLDYSGEMLRIARVNIRNVLPNLNMLTSRTDFETPNFPDVVRNLLIVNEVSDSHLMLLLGHTLGNPIDRAGSLANIGKSMRSGDILLVGVELYQPHRVPEILAHYQNEPFHRAVFECLTFAGFRREDGLLNVTFDHTTRDVRVTFRLLTDVSLEVDPARRLHFATEEEIMIFLSHRFEVPELEQLCSTAGLTVMELVQDDRATYVLLVARR